ncbi:MAG TPA: alpha/beta hydrolase [Methylomirabilota bacterium]|nr:alpha/beta hydrolase [Methylomirabilota bacterium]
MSVLAHTRAGDGTRAIVLLHGFLGSARNLATLARGLAERVADASVWALDLTGHGDSPPLPPRPTLDGIARGVLDTTRGLGVAVPWTLVGHSLGGRVALHAALAEPAALRQLTLLDVTPSPREAIGEVAGIVKALAAAPAEAPDRRTFRAWFEQAGLPAAAIDWLLLNVAQEGDVYRWRIDRAALAALYPAIGAEDLWPAVEGRRPYGLHVIRGADSGYVTDADVRRLTAAGARVDTLAGAGHFLHADRPKELLDRIVQGVQS